MRCYFNVAVAFVIQDEASVQSGIEAVELAFLKAVAGVARRHAAIGAEDDGG